MRFDTYLPCEPLKPYINLFAVTESTSQNSYRVLPGTELVIGFQYKGHLSYVDSGARRPLSTSGITGLHNSYRLFESSANVGTVLVYFKEAAAAAFIKQPIHELFQHSVSLDNFMLRSELILVEEQLCEAKTDEEKIGVVEQFLLSRMQEPVTDGLVVAALSLIHQSKGTLRINELVKQLHTSQSTLEKRFRSLVGTSPKKFASIVRFKHILRQHDPQNSLTELGYESGFYDQAHFIKEFKAFTGETPDSYFSATA